MERPAILWLFIVASLAAREPEPGYRTPPEPIRAIADAPPTPEVRVSPDRKWLLLLDRAAYVTLEDLARPEVGLAGLRLNPRTNGPSRAPYATGISLKSIADGQERRVTGLPEGARLTTFDWSPDSARFAFLVTRETGVELWCVEASEARARALTGPSVNAAIGAPYAWLPTSDALVVRLVPGGRGTVPTASVVPDGPVVQESLGRKAPARTYTNLLKNPSDEALFEHLASAQAYRVELRGAQAPIGPAGLLIRAEPSPDGSYVLAETLTRPFSYVVPLSRFPRRVEVWDAAGSVVKVLAEIGLKDEVPIAFGAVPTGPRGFSWREDAPATVCWAEAQDGGDPAVEAEVRDRVLLLAAPFDGQPATLVDLALRFDDVQWGKEDLALVTESWRKTRRTRTWVVDPSKPGAAPRLLFDRSTEDQYADPGEPVLRTLPNGRSVLHLTDGGASLFLIGEGASPEGVFPFLSRLDLASGKAAHAWRCKEPYYERPVALLDDGARVLTRRESATEPPNYLMRDLASGEAKPVTSFPHPYPQLEGMTKEVIRYERADGVKLNATLYLPPGYKKEDGPLPVLMWAYPVEFKSADLAGQVTDSPFRFARVHWGSPLFWLTRGFAVLDDPKMPIIGEGDVEPNDTYVEQLVASAKAAVDEVARRGVGDPERVAIGGHSYGAFMVANLLAHSDLFRAGIARSGAYNRTLTPFGFQGEDRPFWQAVDVYVRMSPFTHAEKVNEPILMVHGAADDNSGTYPMQSERFYAALKGNGATVRFVMLPLESHWYEARESVMHVLWETDEWLTRYVKEAGPR